MRVETRVRKISNSVYVLVPHPFGEEVLKKKAYIEIENEKIKIVFE